MSEDEIYVRAGTAEERIAMLATIRRKLVVDGLVYVAGAAAWVASLWLVLRASCGA